MGKNTHTRHGAGIFTYVSLVNFIVNVDKYTIHVSRPVSLSKLKLSHANELFQNEHVFGQNKSAGLALLLIQLISFHLPATRNSGSLDH